MRPTRRKDVTIYDTANPPQPTGDTYALFTNRFLCDDTITSDNENPGPAVGSDDDWDTIRCEDPPGRRLQEAVYQQFATSNHAFNYANDMLSGFDGEIESGDVDFSPVSGEANVYKVLLKDAGVGRCLVWQEGQVCGDGPTTHNGVSFVWNWPRISDYMSPPYDASGCPDSARWIVEVVPHNFPPQAPFPPSMPPSPPPPSTFSFETDLNPGWSTGGGDPPYAFVRHNGTAPNYAEGDSGSYLGVEWSFSTGPKYSTRATTTSLPRMGRITCSRSPTTAACARTAAMWSPPSTSTITYAAKAWAS